jgi:hypothetical protein
MATFYQLTPDAFNSGFQGLSSQTQTQNKNSGNSNTLLKGRYDNVRRPVRGIQIKDDTYATLQVRTADGRNTQLIDAGGPIQSSKDSTYSYSYQYSNFLIQSIQQQRAEKKQIVETFGEPYVFFFGQHPVMLQIQGVLLNTEDFNWRAEFMENYDKYLRGTACVQNKTRVYLSWDTIVTEGYILDCTTQEVSAERHWLNFSFTMFLTNYADVSPIGLSDFPRPAEFQLDPTSFDTSGFGTGFGVSRDLAQERLLNAAVFGSNSLIDTMKDLLTNATGFLSGVAQQTLSLFSGRQTLVPTSLSDLIDPNDTQVAFGSVGLISPIDGRVVTLPPGNDRFAAATYGPIQKNLDEYIARLPAWGANTQPIVSDLFQEQTAAPANVGDMIQTAVAGFGIKAPAPADLINSAKGGKFTTIASFTPDSTITKTSGGLPGL